MKANELRKLSTEELTAKEKALKEELFNLRFQMATGALDATSRLSLAKQDIARILTIQAERRHSLERR